MRLSGLSVLVLVLTLILPVSFACAQGSGSAEKLAESSASATSTSEVDQLRHEVAAQRKMIEDLQSTVQHLLKSPPDQDTDSVSADLDRAVGGLRVVPVSVAQGLSPAEKKPAEKKPAATLEFPVAGGKVQFYGHASLSYDYVDNGISSAAVLARYTPSPIPGVTALQVLARENNGWLGQISSNLSYFGIRGSHPITHNLTAIFQMESEVNMAGNSGTTSDGQCKFCLGSRDSYVGLQGSWGAVKIGREDAPYKKSTSSLDPFLYTIGDYRSIMGNSGGDNRAEFMTRTAHAIWYESPTHKGLSASVLFSPGQNRASDNSAYARGEPNCSAGNGVFTLSLANSPNVAEGADLNTALIAATGASDTNPCNDGSWGNILSTAVTYRGHGAYLLTAYEHHSKVNRTTDLVGVTDEAAWKVGLQYTFHATGTTPNFIYEKLKRYGPGVDPRLDERSRPNTFYSAITQKMTNKDEFDIAWGYAGKTPGDPGFCSPFVPGNCAPGQNPLTAPFNVVNNATNLYNIGFKHHFTPKITSYFVYSRQKNHVDAHYDLGAVGHNIPVDKRDFLGTGFVGTRLQGVSGGMTYDF